MKAQLKELLTNYGDISVLWFDGEWEDTWTTEYGRDVYDYVRSLQPNIIVNNRVGAGRMGMEGMNREGDQSGDFSTPEQQIPATGLPGVDWESCMTMNYHWGWNKNDHNWKSTTELIQMLADIASKGGNFLLNIGPKPDGTFPQESIDRLQQIGQWMNIYGESIYGTSASPFKSLSWGRCTQKTMDENTRLYLHVFEWPKNKSLVVPGIYNDPIQAFLLANPDTKLHVSRIEDSLQIAIPDKATDRHNSIIVLDVKGTADVNNPPQLKAKTEIFIDSLEVSFDTNRKNIEIRYTLDGSAPTATSPSARKIILTKPSTVTAQCFRDGKTVSGLVSASYKKESPLSAFEVIDVAPGVLYSYYEGNWDSLPDFSNLTPKKSGSNTIFNLKPREQGDLYAFKYDGFIKIDEKGVYSFFTASDDGSQLFIDGKLIVDNNGLHGLHEEGGTVALESGMHSIQVTYFENDGGDNLEVLWRKPGFYKQEIPENVLFHKK
jgi:alpha-L-fucosidase